MNKYPHFTQHKHVIRSLELDKLKSVANIPNTLLMAQDGDLSISYIPFDHVNSNAKIVLVGITPGFTQLTNALVEAQKNLIVGSSDDVTLAASKKTGAFSGAMRPNLVAMLNHIKINDWLNLPSTEELFGSASRLVHTTSILRYPVFIKGENYNGTPNMTKHPLLRQQILSHFAEEVAQLKSALFIPLGPKVSEGLMWLASQGLIDYSKVLDGMPHPSGANAERIAYFIGKKKCSDLSIKTDPNKIDLLKTELLRKISKL